MIVYVGMTKEDFLKKELGAHEIFNKYKDDDKYAFRAKKIFLHPKLQTSKVLSQIKIYCNENCFSSLEPHQTLLLSSWRDK